MYKISTNDTDKLQRMNHQLINKGTHAKLGVYSCLLKRFTSAQQAVVEWCKTNGETVVLRATFNISSVYPFKKHLLQK